MKSRLLLSVLFACIFALTNAWAAPTPISACRRITVPGPYVLTKNITATAATMTPITWLAGYTGCIVIVANNVTVDMAGYLITGTGTGVSTIGVATDSTTTYSDVVRSGAVTNFHLGIAIAGTAHSVQNVNSSSNVWGIYFLNAGNRAIGNTATGNAYGIYSAACPNLFVENAAQGNANDLIDNGACSTRQENVPAP